MLSEAAKACLAGQAPGGRSAEPDRLSRRLTAQTDQATQYEQALARRPEDLPTIVDLGRTYLRAGNPYMARMVLGKGSRSARTGQSLNLFGIATAHLGEYQAALELFGRAPKKALTTASPRSTRPPYWRASATSRTAASC